MYHRHLTQGTMNLCKKALLKPVTGRFGLHAQWLYLDTNSEVSELEFSLYYLVTL